MKIKKINSDYDLDVNYVREFIISLSEKEIVSGIFSNGVDKCCIVGHFERLHSENPNDYSTKNCWDLDGKKTSPLRAWANKYHYDIASINNNYYQHTGFLQPTRKKRLLAMCDEIEKTEIEKTKIQNEN